MRVGTGQISEGASHFPLHFYLLFCTVCFTPMRTINKGQVKCLKDVGSSEDEISDRLFRDLGMRVGTDCE